MHLKMEIFRALEDRLIPAGDNDMYRCRCPLCGDSQKDERKTRFYIKFDFADPNSPIEYICFNCNDKGYMKPYVLRAFELNRLHLNSGLMKMNHQADKNKQKERKLLKKLNIKVPVYPDTDKYQWRKKYIEYRLGRSFTFEELQGLKAVMDLSTFLNYNAIDQITCSKEKALLLENQYVGFLSSMNHMVIFRNMKKDEHQKHQKYMLLKDVQSYKFYTIPSTVEICSEKTIYLNIAEGVYDILGVYYHINHQDKNNQIYVGATGSSFHSIIDYYIEKGVVGNVVLNIFSDQDKKPYFHKRLIEQCTPFFREVNLIYNTKGKDYGVPKEQIQLYQYRE